MTLQSLDETVANEEGTIHLGFDLSGTEAGYVLVSLPAGASESEDEFFGTDHYVEVKDQLFGQYGGIERLSVLSDTGLTISLLTDVPNVGREISIIATRPMSTAMLQHLRRLERP